MDALTDLQKLAAVGRRAKDWYFEHIGRVPDGGLGWAEDFRKLDDAHADDPKWFPVKFERGDWVAHESGAAGFVEDPDPEFSHDWLIARNLHNDRCKWLKTHCCPATAEEIGQAGHRLDTEELGWLICEHYKP